MMNETTTANTHSKSEQETRRPSADQLAHLASLLPLDVRRHLLAQTPDQQVDTIREMHTIASHYQQKLVSPDQSSSTTIYQTGGTPDERRAHFAAHASQLYVKQDKRRLNS